MTMEPYPILSFILMWVYRTFKQAAFGMHVFVTQTDFETIQEFPSLERFEMFMAEESQ